MSAYPRGRGDGLDPLTSRFQSNEDRIRQLEIPSGTRFGNVKNWVRTKLAELQVTVTELVADAMANYYTKAETDAKVASPGDIAPGNVTASGSVSAGGDVSGSTGTFAGGLNSIDARNRLLTSSYVSAYWDGSGQAGYVPSSLRVKTIQGEYVVSLEDWLALEPQWFVYTHDENQTPRAGFIAEWVNEEFPEFVIHDDGQAAGIHYEFMIAGMQSAFRQYVAQTDARIAALEARLG